MHLRRRRSFLFKTISLLLLQAILILIVITPGFGAVKKMNVLLVTIDTLRADHLGVYSGKTGLTPEIDEWAQKAVVFKRAFAQATTTLPAHASILLGVTPLFHGVHENGTFYIQDELLTLAEHLQQHGWMTGAFVGAYPLDSRFGLDQGFAVYDDEYGSQNFDNHDYVERRAEVVVDKALSWLAKANEPWFLWIHCYDPHQPYEPPAPFSHKFPSSPYAGEVAYVSYQLGRLFSWLNRSGFTDDTIVILTGDHGEGLGDHGERTHGYFAYNSTLWIPLIIYAPGVKPHQVESFVSHQDIFPTVCDLLELPIPADVQGKSLKTGLKGRKIKESIIYFESLYPYYSRGWAPLRGLIIDHQKYIDSPIPELYDLNNDFHEEKNIITASRWTDLRKKLEDYKRKNSSSLAEGAEFKKKDPEVSRRLRSLGYLAQGSSPPSINFSAANDVKTMLPFENRIEEAWQMANKGQIEEAISILNQVRKAKPELDATYTRLSLLYKKQGQLEEALRVLEQGREALPLSYEIFSNYVSLLLDLRRYQEVVQVINSSSLRQSKSDPELWNYLGVAYGHLGEFESAVKAYDLALSLDSDYPVAAANRGVAATFLYRQTGKEEWFDLAHDSFDLAIKADKNFVTAYNGLAFLYHLAGDRQRAIEAWEKAVGINPDFGPALYNLGLAYLQQGQKDKALSWFLNYKEKFFDSLRQEEKKKLEELINQCQSKK